ncbi:hypothetical protein LTR62_003586 [Meristemomyces frigidus]|uniref:Uncharacterized protein n=1 Tax=Meristemomyces frigidus TaxID=1508187 RepID=A0AAN7TEU9_9PEZI|nr:hypothetical protein LTR62_003586 [Meristemomyces frigidus]
MRDKEHQRAPICEGTQGQQPVRKTMATAYKVNSNYATTTPRSILSGPSRCQSKPPQKQKVTFILEGEVWNGIRPKFRETDLSAQYEATHNEIDTCHRDWLAIAAVGPRFSPKLAGLCRHCGYQITLTRERQVLQERMIKIHEGKRKILLVLYKTKSLARGAQIGAELEAQREYQ